MIFRKKIVLSCSPCSPLLNDVDSHYSELFQSYSMKGDEGLGEGMIGLCAAAACDASSLYAVNKLKFFFASNESQLK